jgi:hypothetical protein
MPVELSTRITYGSTVSGFVIYAGRRTCLARSMVGGNRHPWLARLLDDRHLALRYTGAGDEYGKNFDSINT